jgi:hypothetical protein
MLTREEAQELLLKRLKERQDRRKQVIEEHLTIERPFGWLFFVSVSGSSVTTQEEAISHRLIIVNKHAEQVIESSIDYTPQRFIEIYETLLAKSQVQGQNWCLTMSWPFPWKRSGRENLANKAKEMGLYEIK